MPVYDVGSDAQTPGRDDDLFRQLRGPRGDRAMGVQNGERPVIDVCDLEMKEASRLEHATRIDYWGY